jgi:hypothetical protein
LWSFVRRKADTTLCRKTAPAVTNSDGPTFNMASLWHRWQMVPQKYLGDQKVLLKGVKRLIRYRFISVQVEEGADFDWANAELTRAVRDLNHTAGRWDMDREDGSQDLEYGPGVLVNRWGLSHMCDTGRCLRAAAEVANKSANG